MKTTFVNGINPFQRALRMGYCASVQPAIVRFRPLYKEPSAPTTRTSRKQLMAYIEAHPLSTPRMLGEVFNARGITMRNRLAILHDEGVLVREKVREGGELVYAYSATKGD